MLGDPTELQNKANQDFRDLASEEFDTRTLLRNAAEQAIVRKYEDFLIVDTDSHHYETEAFKEIAEYIDDPVLRHEAKYQGVSRGGLTSETGLYQEIGVGNITAMSTPIGSIQRSMSVRSRCLSPGTFSFLRPG